MPGAPPSARTTRPESSAIAGSPLAPAAAFAFSAAFASKLSPVSSGSAMPSAPAEAECHALMPGELGDTRPGEPQHLGEERLVERGTFGGRLDLDDPAGSGKHKIRIGFGLRILGIVEVEHCRPRDDPAGDRGNRVAQWQTLQEPNRHQVLTRLVQRHVAAGDRSGAGAAIRLQDIAIDADLAFAEPGQIDDSAQAAPDQPL